MLFHPLHSKSSWPKVALVSFGFPPLLCPSFLSMLWRNSRPNPLKNNPFGRFLVQTHPWKLPNFWARSSGEIWNGVYKHCLLLIGKQLDFTISQTQHSNRKQGLKKEMKQLKKNLKILDPDTWQKDITGLCYHPTENTVPNKMLPTTRQLWWKLISWAPYHCKATCIFCNCH